MYDTIVVGSGIFGSVIAAHLRAGGQRVIVVGDDRQDSGSRPAGCVMKPSWISSLSRDDYSLGLKLLDDLYGVRTIQFVLRPKLTTVEAQHVNPQAILRGCTAHPDFVAGVVRNTGEDGEAVAVQFTNYEDKKSYAAVARHLVVAAGIWTGELCPWVQTKAQYGWSFRGPPVREPVISLWAPYRQVVAFNMDDGRSWSGDGSSLKLESATHERQQKALHRCHVAMGHDPLRRDTYEVARGARPYAETGGRPCLIARRGSVWAVTGGAKNGTIAAAWAARELEREMRL